MTAEPTAKAEAVVTDLERLAARIRANEEEAAELWARRTPTWQRAVEAGISIRAIGTIFGLQDQSVKYHLKREGVPVPRQARHRGQKAR